MPGTPLLLFGVLHLLQRQTDQFSSLPFYRSLPGGILSSSVPFFSSSPQVFSRPFSDTDVKLNMKFSSICKPVLEVRSSWDVQDFRHTLDSSLWCWGLSYTIWKVILQLLPETAPLGQDFRQGKKSLNRKLLLLFVVPPARNLPENTVRTFLWWDNLSLPFWAWL